MTSTAATQERADRELATALDEIDRADTRAHDLALASAFFESENSHSRSRNRNREFAAGAARDAYNMAHAADDDFALGFALFESEFEVRNGLTRQQRLGVGTLRRDYDHVRDDRGRSRSRSRDRSSSLASDSTAGVGVECVICQRVMTARQKRRKLPCSGAHVFHSACIDRWLHRKRTCPVDRDPV